MSRLVVATPYVLFNLVCSDMYLELYTIRILSKVNTIYCMYVHTYVEASIYLTPAFYNLHSVLYT